MFSISDQTIKRDELFKELENHSSGALVTFEGLVRNHNEGKKVSSLEYQVYRELAQKEGEKILQEAREKFNIHHVRSIHREGHLALGDMAIWIGATASHRDDAFKACRFVIDEIKHRLPVWKKEHYLDSEAQWVFCQHHHHHVHFEEKDYYQKQSKVTDQGKLKGSRVLIVGMGGLGCPASLGLASAGVGQLTLVDFDKISISNLHRQSLYAANLVGEKKVAVARMRLSELNPFIDIKTVDSKVTSGNVEELMAGHDLVLDCTDNLATKYLLHDACLKLKVPFISASVYRSEGQLRTVIPGNGCFRCINDQTPDDGYLGNCNDLGVLGTTVNVLGSLQANEALKLLQFGTNSSIAETLYLNLSDLTLMKIRNGVNPDCPACKGQASYPAEDAEVFLSDLSDYELVDLRNEDDVIVEKYKNYDKKVLLCCDLGVRSHSLAKKLRAHGHSHFYSLKGGACSL